MYGRGRFWSGLGRDSRPACCGRLVPPSSRVERGPRNQFSLQVSQDLFTLTLTAQGTGRHFVIHQVDSGVECEFDNPAGLAED